jgi:hypothetical protein
MKIKMDTYSLKARLYPAFLVLFPFFITAITNLTDFEKYYQYFTAVFSLGLFTYLLSQLGRDLGKKKEPYLFKSWKGKPSVKILRHDDNYLDEITKARYHKALLNNIPEIKIPTKEEENANSENADCIYESCTKFLISKTRDIKKYPLLFKENVSYGFRRNLWGMKSLAILFISICMLIHTYFAIDSFTNFQMKITDILVYLFFICDLIFWSLIVTKDWIKIPAYAYAERLLESLNNF